MSGNNYILVVFDSCRYDSFMRARPRIMKKLGKVERRWSYASWTSPSHYNLLIGLMPHVSPKHVYASEYYKKEFLQFNERLGRHDIQFKSLVLGYTCRCSCRKPWDTARMPWFPCPCSIPRPC